MPTRDSTDSDATSRLVDAALAGWMERQYRLSAAAMLHSISAVRLTKERPAFGQTIRPVRGSVLASPALASYDPDPDYFFHWLRDSAIVIDAVGTLIEDGTYGADARGHVGDFVRFSLALGDLDGRALLESGAARRAVDPNFQQYLRPGGELSKAAGENIPGETRFNPDGTLDITKWARPQHDGPALRALTIMRFWRRRFFDDAGTRDTARRLIETDLAFTHRRWRAPSFDIWEEEIGHHYYTRLVQYSALCDGADWTEEIGDSRRAEPYRSASREIARYLDDHWDAARGFYLSRIGATGEHKEKELDAAVVLAVIHARRDGGAHSVCDPRGQATLARLENLFAREYPINQPLPQGRGAAMGRYAGDRYYSGGAYYFATLGAAEFFFRLAEATARGAPASDMPHDRLASLGIGVGADGTPDRPGVADALINRGDGFMMTVRAYTPASGELSEQFDRATGQQTSSKNLTWSHAALVTAVAARRAACRAVGRRER